MKRSDCMTGCATDANNGYHTCNYVFTLPFSAGGDATQTSLDSTPNKRSHTLQPPPVQNHNAIHQSANSCAIEEATHKAFSGGYISRHVHSGAVRRRRPSTGTRSPTSPIMSYSAANLDDPAPEWSAYNPQEGVSWMPRRSHKHKTPEQGSFRKFRSVGSIQNLRSVRSKQSKVLSRSSSSLNFPFWSRRRQCPVPEEVSADVDRAWPTNLTGEPSYRLPKDAVDGNVLQNGVVPLPATPPPRGTGSPTDATIPRTTRRRCYTDCSSELPWASKLYQNIRNRSRSRTRALSRESISELTTSWASFDEYNWDKSELVLDEHDDVFDDNDDEVEADHDYVDPYEECRGGSNDDADRVDLWPPSSPSVPDEAAGHIDSISGDRLKHFLQVHDLACLFIPRYNLRTGKLLMKGLVGFFPPGN